MTIKHARPSYRRWSVSNFGNGFINLFHSTMDTGLRRYNDEALVQI
jgi:hypothetical protein